MCTLLNLTQIFSILAHILDAGPCLPAGRFWIQDSCQNNTPPQPAANPLFHNLQIVHAMDDYHPLSG
ncbi:MAG: hypothetical protein Q8M94_19540 [Ignavibacteria bacterium]|nr:hypothetical protein [Ignavibacteria bacterium]